MNESANRAMRLISGSGRPEVHVEGLGAEQRHDRHYAQKDRALSERSISGKFAQVCHSQNLQNCSTSTGLGSFALAMSALPSPLKSPATPQLGLPPATNGLRQLESLHRAS